MIAQHNGLSSHQLTGSNETKHLEVADIFRTHGHAFRQNNLLTKEQLQVMADIEACRTAVLGGHADVCQDCGHVEVSFNSCRNRHCPKCQGLAQAKWIASRKERILPTHYFHLVFTLPEELRTLTLGNRREIYKLLFKAATSTVLEISNNPKWLGATPALTAVLHTWTRTLQYHPHLHCIVSGGGLGSDGQWVSTNQDFLFPVHVLSSLFRGKFLHGLRQLYKDGELRFKQDNGSQANNSGFDELVDRAYKKSWVVYVKPPFGGAKAVFAYLGRYTHRVAISNARLKHFDDEKVTFATKGGASTTIDAMEFIRRFLLHVLPKGFVKIRHYGLLCASHAKTKLEQARACLESDQTSSRSDEHLDHEQPSPELEWKDMMRILTGIDLSVCPRCGGLMIREALPTVPRCRLKRKEISMNST